MTILSFTTTRSGAVSPSMHAFTFENRGHSYPLTFDGIIRAAVELAPVGLISEVRSCASSALRRIIWARHDRGFDFDIRCVRWDLELATRRKYRLDDLLMISRINPSVEDRSFLRLENIVAALDAEQLKRTGIPPVEIPSIAFKYWAAKFS